MDITTSVALSISYMVMASHLWMQRRPLSLKLGRLWQMITTGQLCFFCPVAVSKVEDRVVREMDEVRVRNIRASLEFGAPVMAPCMLVMTMIIAFGEITLTGNGLLLFASVLMLYSCVVIFSQFLLAVSVRKVNICYSVFMALMMFRALAHQNSPYFFVMSGNRLGMRILFGLMMLNHRRSLFEDVALSIILCWSYSSNCSVFRESLPAYHTVIFIFLEACQLIVSRTTAHQVEIWMESSVRASIHARDADNAKRAVDCLLSVLCDADLQVGPDLCIIKPSNKLGHLLASTHGIACRNLKGCSIMEFIAERDHSRFCDFLACSTSWLQHGEQPSPQEMSSVSPPASISLQMKDANGRQFPVDLFQVHLQALFEQPGHLFGVRESCLRPREADVQATSSSDHLRFWRYSDQCSSSEDHRQEVPTPEPQIAASHSSSSSAGSSAGSLVQQQQLTHLERITVQLDAFSTRFSVRKCVFSFASPTDCSDSPYGPPNLADWMPPSTWDTFNAWVQEHVNASLADNSDETPERFGPLTLQWPTSDPSSRCLSAESIELEFPEEDNGDDDQDSLFLRLQLTNLSQFRSHSGELRGSRRHRHRQSSSRRVAETRQRLPPIGEA